MQEEGQVLRKDWALCSHHLSQEETQIAPSEPLNATTMFLLITVHNRAQHKIDHHQEINRPAIQHSSPEPIDC